METKLIQFNDNIYAIDQQMVRCFVIIGEKEALLLDTGAKPIDLLSYIRQITDKPIQLCLTHSDVDHIANLEQFDKVYLHKEELPLLKINKEIEIVTIDQGFVFDLGGIKLEVIHTPGHTPGSISLLDQVNKVLFSGDTVSYGPVYMFGQNRDLHEYSKTLKMLEKKANDHEFQYIYPCHNTCPLDTHVIAHLIQCVEGIVHQNISGVEAKMPFPMPIKPLLYQYEDCGILYIQK